MAVEEGPVLPRVGDVVAHTGQPLERVEGLEVAPQGRVQARAVEDGLLAVEVDELAEREGVSHEVGGGVLESLPLLRRDGLPHVCGEAPSCGPVLTRPW